ncbi:MAG: ankyrin repeat domain-containing protein [Cellulophaga sp.]
MKSYTKPVISFVAALVFCVSSNAQEENPFFSRDFWNEKPSTKIVQQKIEEGHSLTEVSSRGLDALQNAILYANDLETTKLLIENGANIHKKIKRGGRTAAFWSVYKDNFEILSYLLSKGVKADLKDDRGNSLIMYAASSGASDKRIYDLLLEKGATLKNVVDKNNRNAILLYAGRIKNMEMVDYFLSKGLSIHSVDKDGNGLFHYVARSKNKKFLEGLIKRGVSYEPNAKTGDNAFTFAVKRNRNGSVLSLELLQYLESLGLDPKAIAKVGTTSLNTVAYSEKNIEIFKYFVKKGVDPNAKDKNGNTAFMRAAFRNNKEVVSYLLGLTKDINQQNHEGYTAVLNAVRRNSPGVVEFLLKKGADLNQKDQKGNDIGCLLVDGYRRDLSIFREKMEILKKHGYNPKKAKVQNGNSLLQVAIRNGRTELVKEIVSMQIPLNNKNNEGYTPLHVAAMTAKNDVIIKNLLEAGADKSIKTEFGETVFDLAFENEVLKGKNIDVTYLK